MATDRKVLDWRDGGKHLPRFMRDFHDQKDVFKTIHDTVNIEGNEYAKSISWVAGQCYVIDIFLWFMARHGYVMRKAEAKLPFDDLNSTIADARERGGAIMARALGLNPIERE